MTEQSEDSPSVYERFIEESDAMLIKADDSAVAVVGMLTRAVKRAQLVYDGDLPTVAIRKQAWDDEPGEEVFGERYR